MNYSGIFIPNPIAAIFRQTCETYFKEIFSFHQAAIPPQWCIEWKYFIEKLIKKYETE